MMIFYQYLFNCSDQKCIKKNQQACKDLRLEILEPRLALDSHGLTRPGLEQAAMIRIDNSLGPNPIIFTKSELIGQETNSFVITSVAEGSVVEKWNQASLSWQDVSTPVTTSHPSQLIQLLQNRLIQSGDQIRWVPQTTDNQLRNSFAILGWDDGSSNTPPNPALLPSAVQNVEVNSTADGELTVSWSQTTSTVATEHYIV